MFEAGFHHSEKKAARDNANYLGSPSLHNRLKIRGGMLANRANEIRRESIALVNIPADFAAEPMRFWGFWRIKPNGFKIRRGMFAQGANIVRRQGIALIDVSADFAAEAPYGFFRRFRLGFNVGKVIVVRYARLTADNACLGKLGHKQGMRLVIVRGDNFAADKGVYSPL